MLKEHTQVIGGSTWGLNTMPARKALGVFTRLAGLLGPGLGALGTETNVSVVAGSLFERIGQPGSVDLIVELLDGLTKDKRPINFDLEFAGNFGELPEIIWFALEANFGSFFGATSTFPKLLARLAPAAPSPKTSTGASGASS